MKKQGVLLGVLLICVIYSLAFITADDLNFSDSDDEASKIQDARDCLKDKIDEKGCDALSREERIFALLGTGKCKSEVNDDSKNNECWPESGCKIKTTAQAILALNGNTKAEEWLLSQNKSTSDNLIWYLQIENVNSELTQCDIDYGGSSYTINIGEDRKINSPAGSCLTVDTEFGGYWLRVSCFGEEFEISCDKAFLTNLLFKKIGQGEPIHVTSETSGAEAHGHTTEKITSVCFKEGNSCVYEGSLWAALVLDKNYNIDAYKPYLIAMASDTDNKQYLPEAFLYGLGDGSYRNDLLLKQKENKWWLESGNKFYDTALALLPFSDDPPEKANTIDWLLGTQDTNGCWNSGSIRDTAFLLYSLWPKSFSGIITNGNSACSGYCISKLDCADAQGIELGGYCPLTQICCDEPKLLEPCVAQGGIICGSDKTCSGRVETEISDTLLTGETCCIGGSCDEQTTSIESDCETLGNGICEYVCSEGYEITYSYTCDSSDFCCVKESGGGDYTFIWVLVILIILVIIGMMFKDKLRRYWIKLKSKFGKSKGYRRGPGLPPGSPFFTPPPSSRLPLRRPPRRMMPPRRRPPARRPPARRPQGDLDDVLKKLKEMGGS
ncbi:MAG: hypothetical protein KKF48_05060 [Nanoarchaeota archaeon]|nr:hypothetical protein [Nanoarchaeota archaeon]MBU1028387.1 hypothetical protein [Nanoarchaeota archaeon]